MSKVLLGIDFGTKKTCITIAGNLNSTRRFPSIIFYSTEDKHIIATHEAKNKFLSIPNKGIHGMTMLIGLKFNDPLTKMIAKEFQIRVIDDGDNNILIKIGNNSFIKRPFEICIDYFQALKKYVEDDLEVVASEALIAVPVCYNRMQRDIITHSAKAAGFHVGGTIGAPIAAANNYFKEYTFQNFGRGYYLVYDLGCGFFNCSVVELKADCSINIIDSEGKKNRSGNYFDNVILDYVCSFLCYSPTSSSELRRMLYSCEDVKNILSSMECCMFQADGLPEVEITRGQFEQMIENSLKETISIVERCLEKNNLSKNDIEEVILIGGSTRIPKVKQMLEDFFSPSTKLNKILNAVECVAEGTALSAELSDTDTLLAGNEASLESIEDYHDETVEQGIDDFEILEIIYNQNISCVRIVCDKLKKDDKYVIKEIRFGVAPDVSSREIVALSKLNHPNIVKYHKAWTGKTTSEASFSKFEKRSLFIQLELCKSDLTKVPMKSEKTEKIIEYFRQIVLGTSVLHHENIMHRDLKPHNILLGFDGQLRIGDLGSAKENLSELHTLHCGTPLYQSPECASGKYGFKSDIYSLGLILFDMLMGFQENNDERVKNIKRFKAQGFKANCEIKFKTHNKKVELIEKLIEKDPKKRFSAQDALSYIDRNWKELIIPF